MKHVHGVARALSGGDVSVAVGDYQPSSILLTGGAGFIASHVVIRLVQNYPNTKVGLPASIRYALASRAMGMVKAGHQSAAFGMRSLWHPAIEGVLDATVQAAALPRVGIWGPHTLHT